MVALLIFCAMAHAAYIDMSPPQDVLGNWKFDLYDSSNNERGTTTNPLQIGLPPGAATAALQTSILNAVDAPNDSARASYSASVGALGFATNPTDVFTISGSATKIVRVTRLVFSASQTTAGQRDVAVVKRSTANAGGTSAAAVMTTHDSADPAPTAVVKYYTANPTTLGTTVGVPRIRKVFVAATSTNSDEFVIDFGENNAKPIVLRGVAENVTFNLGGAAIAGGIADINVTWTEDTQ